MRWLLMLTVVAVLSGCGSIDAGPKPTEAQFQASVKAWVLTNFSNPSGAQYRFGPIKGGPSENSYWTMCAEVNEKNSSGSYTGFKAYEFLWDANRAYLFDGDTGFGFSCMVPEDTAVTM